MALADLNRLQLKPLRLLAVLTLGVSACAAGCGKGGPPSGRVTGKVTYDSKPVSEGYIAFYNLGPGRSSVVQLDAEGQYQMPEVAVGDYTISIEPLEPKRPNEVTSTPAEIQAQTASFKAPDPKNIPRNYRSPKTSQLKRSVIEGDNEFDFELAEKHN